MRSIAGGCCKSVKNKPTNFRYNKRPYHKEMRLKVMKKGAQHTTLSVTMGTPVPTQVDTKNRHTYTYKCNYKYNNRAIKYKNCIICIIFKRTLRLCVLSFAMHMSFLYQTLLDFNMDNMVPLYLRLINYLNIFLDVLLEALYIWCLPYVIERIKF